MEGIATSVADELARATAILAEADTLFVFTGSGMSAESGIRTFRGVDGLWQAVKPEDVATPQAFERDPLRVWSWYKERILSGWKARPHAGHRALARIQDLYGRQTLSTQNVDLLHEAAGSRNVLHLHGSMSHVRCTGCPNRPELRPPLLRSLPPLCPDCGGILRPDVVWFGEALPEAALREATAAAAACDVALVVGASNLVYPAAGLPLLAKENGARVIEINPEPTPLTASVDALLQGTARETLPKLRETLVGLRGRRRQA